MLQTTPELLTAEKITPSFIEQLKTSFPCEEECNPVWDVDHAKAFIADDHNLFMVSYSNGVLVGFLYGYTLTLFGGEKEFFISKAGTSKTHRHMGVMSSLLTALESLLKTRGFASMRVIARHSNTAGIGTYTKAGLKASEEEYFVFTKSLID